MEYNAGNLGLKAPKYEKVWIWLSHSILIGEIPILIATFTDSLKLASPSASWTLAQMEYPPLTSNSFPYNQHNTIHLLRTAGS